MADKKDTKKIDLKKKSPEKNVQKVKIVKPKKSNKKKQILKEIKRIKKRKNPSKKANPLRKAKLAVKGRQTKWAPVWSVLKKFGTGKKVHPSSITKYRRSWRRTKLHIKPRKQRKSHFG